MSRAIQRLIKDYHKAEKLVGHAPSEPFGDLTSATSFTTQTYAQSMAHIRREPELTQDEKKYLVAVERKRARFLLLDASSMRDRLKQSRALPLLTRHH